MLNVEKIIEAGGVLAISLIIFAESGLLVGFFLPGDTMILSAGLFASKGYFSLYALILFGTIAAIVGDNVGYHIGKRLGPKLFTKKDGIIFRHEYLVKSEAFYKQHGGKAITLARFLPIVRTFTPFVAGAAKMDRRNFMFFNCLGSLAWVGGLSLAGYFLGSKLPSIEKSITPVFALVTLLTFGPPIFHMLKDKTTRDKILAKLKLKKTI